MQHLGQFAASFEPKSLLRSYCVGGWKDVAGFAMLCWGVGMGLAGITGELLVDIGALSQCSKG